MISLLNSAKKRLAVDHKNRTMLFARRTLAHAAARGTWRQSVANTATFALPTNDQLASIPSFFVEEGERTQSAEDVRAAAREKESVEQQSSAQRTEEMRRWLPMRGANSFHFLARFRAIVADAASVAPGGARCFTSASHAQAFVGKRARKADRGPSMGQGAFAHFLAEQRPGLVRQEPGLSHEECNRRLRQHWRQGMSAAEKAPYEARASRDGERFVREKARLRYERLLDYRERAPASAWQGGHNDASECEDGGNDADLDGVLERLRHH